MGIGPRPAPPIVSARIADKTAGASRRGGSRRIVNPEKVLTHRHRGFESRRPCQPLALRIVMSARLLQQLQARKDVCRFSWMKPGAAQAGAARSGFDSKFGSPIAHNTNYLELPDRQTIQRKISSFLTHTIQRIYLRLDKIVIPCTI